jgi:hydroxyacylglutathione hydrolase
MADLIYGFSNQAREALDTHTTATYDIQTIPSKETRMEILDDLHVFLWDHPMANNCNTYFIDGQKKILIDPGHYEFFGNVRDGLSNLSLTPEDMDVVLITHGHPDHIESVQVFTEMKALVAISEIELDFIRKVVPHYGQAIGAAAFETDILLHEGTLEIGAVSFRVIHTPGHSPGSVCFYWPGEKVLFSGDVVFKAGIGRTDLPMGDGAALKESIRRLSALDIEYVLSGHGDIIEGAGAVKANFQEIEDFWFGYI